MFESVQEIYNPASQGDDAYGWRYFTDGTSIAPTGNYYQADTMVYDASVGPQNNGTYEIPVNAQQVNLPQNTAGYSSVTPDWVGKILSQGIGALTQVKMAQAQIDYRRAEATNGGLFFQGRPAYLARNGAGQVGQPVNLSALLMIGGLLWFLSKG